MCSAEPGHAPWFAFQLFGLAVRFSKPDFDSSYYAFHVWAQVVMMALMFAIIAVLFVHVLIVLLSGKRHAFYFDEFAGTAAHYRKQDESGR